MRHARPDNLTPAARGGRPAVRRHAVAFTLVEMLVSLAVLTLALGIVGVIFTVTTKTSSQASAYSEAQVYVQQFMTQLQADLAQCNPSESILLIRGRTQAAALTADDLAARMFHRVLVGNPQNVPAGFDPALTPGPVSPDSEQYSDPRADLLMFFTNRPVTSHAPPRAPSGTTPAHPTNHANHPLGTAAVSGVKFSPVQVVYGHAALGDPYFRSATGYYEYPADGNLQHIEQTLDGPLHPASQSVLPANQWHLARRQVILASYRRDTPVLSDASFNHGTTDTMESLVRCEPRIESHPTQNYTDWLPGDMAWIDNRLLLELFDASSMYALTTDNPAGSGTVPLAAISPYYLWQNSADVRNALMPLLYRLGTGDDEYRHVATVLRSVPVELRGNLGVQLLPACTWFQVEFLMPEDPRNSRTYASPDAFNAIYSRPSDMLRWTAVEHDKTYVFLPDTPANRAAIVAAGLHSDYAEVAGRLADFGRLDQAFVNPHLYAPDALEQRIIRLWPYAIRVTIHVYDGLGRLEQPIVRSIVHRFD